MLHLIEGDMVDYHTHFLYHQMFTCQICDAQDRKNRRMCHVSERHGGVHIKWVLT